MLFLIGKGNINVNFCEELPFIFSSFIQKIKVGERKNMKEVLSCLKRKIVVERSKREKIDQNIKLQVPKINPTATIS